MKIYLASAYRHRKTLWAYAHELRQAGHEITSRWLNGTHEAADGDMSMWGDFAKDDLEDIVKCDLLILFTESQLVPRNSRMVELGIAIGMGKKVAIVGPRENVFCCLPEVLHYEDWRQFVSLWAASSDLQGVANG